jgi:hypothetical protein
MRSALFFQLFFLIRIYQLWQTGLCVRVNGSRPQTSARRLKVARWHAEQSAHSAERRETTHEKLAKPTMW